MSNTYVLVERSECPKCGSPSASPPAEVYCVECATEGWKLDAERWKVARLEAQLRGAVSASEVAEALREQGHLMSARRTRGAWYAAADFVLDRFGGQ